MILATKRARIGPRERDLSKHTLTKCSSVIDNESVVEGEFVEVWLNGESERRRATSEDGLSCSDMGRVDLEPY